MTPRRKADAPPAADIELASFPAPPQPATRTEQRREDELESLLQNLGDDSRIQVYNEGKYAGVMPASSVSLETIFDQFGGGEKTIIIFQGRQKVETLRLSFDPSIPPTSPTQRKREQEAAAATRAGGDAGGTAALFTQMAQGQLASQQSMMTMMTGLASAMTAMVGAMKPTTDPTEQAVRLAMLLRDNGNSRDPFEAMKFGIELAKNMNPGEDDGTMTAIREGLNIVGKAIDAHREHAASAGRTPAALAAGPSAESVTGMDAAPIVVVQPDDRIWVREAAEHVGTLVKFSKLLPAKAAAVALNERISDAAFEDLIDDMSDVTPPGFAHRLLQRFPQLADVGAEYLQTLLAEMATFAEDDDDTTGSNGESDK